MWTDSTEQLLEKSENQLLKRKTGEPFCIWYWKNTGPGSITKRTRRQLLFNREKNRLPTVVLSLSKVHYLETTKRHNEELVEIKENIESKSMCLSVIPFPFNGTIVFRAHSIFPTFFSLCNLKNKTMLVEFLLTPRLL